MNPGWQGCMDRANAEAARTGRRQVVELERPGGSPYGRQREQAVRDGSALDWKAPGAMWTTYPQGDPYGLGRYVWPADRAYRPGVRLP